jgi:hypothetical protein
MGDEVTARIIHLHNTTLKTTKQRVLKKLNDIDTVIVMEISETATFGDIGMFTILEVILSYMDPSCGPTFTCIEVTQTG